MFTVTLVGGNPGETLDASGNEHGSPAVVADPIVEEKGRHLFFKLFNSGWSGGCVESPRFHQACSALKRTRWRR